MKKVVASIPAGTCPGNEHCYCRSKTVHVSPVTTKRVRYCCFCGHEQGSEKGDSSVKVDQGDT